MKKCEFTSMETEQVFSYVPAFRHLWLNIMLKKIKEKNKRKTVGKYLLESLLNLFSRKLIFSTGVLKSKPSFPLVSPTQLIIPNHRHFILNYLKGQFKYIHFQLVSIKVISISSYALGIPLPFIFCPSKWITNCSILSKSVQGFW